MGVSSNKILHKYTNPTSHYVFTLVSAQSLSDSNFPEAAYNAEGRQQPPGIEQRYRVSTLPATWPQNWEPRQFSFPDVYPQMPPRDDAPPQQFNVNRILEFVLH
jgi:hypothetical protein